jgi:hypothetical protein
MSEKSDTGKALLSTVKEAALGTIGESKPFVSAVSYIYNPSAGEFGTVVMLISDLARHTQSIQKNPSVSLFVSEPGAAPVYERKRVSAQGTAKQVKDPEAFERFKAQYIGTFPSSEKFFGFADFRFYEIQITEMHLISGFGKIETLR